MSQLEERDIHERAEIYSMSVSPDEDHYIPPDEQNEDSMIVTATGYGHHRVYQVPQKRKRRNYMSDSVFLTYHNESDPYDNSHKLPIGRHSLSVTVVNINSSELTPMFELSIEEYITFQ